MACIQVRVLHNGNGCGHATLLQYNGDRVWIYGEDLFGYFMQQMLLAFISDS